MAVLPDYVTGTITLANGSTIVTGTGTMFATAAFRPGDTLQIQNLTAIIASVDSNTSLTLTEPWTGTSLTNAPYRARYLPDGARVTAQTTTLIELLGNGVLTNIASVPVEDGKLLVGNAAGQYEPISKDELGVPDPNGSVASLAALTLAARQILQTDASKQLKQVALAANKAIVTDSNGDLSPIDLGTLGRTLLALANGTGAQYVQGDGTLQPKAELPVSTAMQTALDAKIGSGQVLPAVASGAAGAIGTYGLMRWVGSTVLSPGQTTSGVNLEFTNGAGNSWSVPSGTWRLMSGAGTASDQARVGLWMRYL
nr:MULTISPECIES: hypothetical protein [unclassified Ochrobactrum]